MTCILKSSAAKRNGRNRDCRRASALSRTLRLQNKKAAEPNRARKRAANGRFRETGHEMDHPCQDRGVTVSARSKTAERALSWAYCY